MQALGWTRRQVTIGNGRGLTRYTNKSVGHPDYNLETATAKTVPVSDRAKQHTAAKLPKGKNVATFKRPAVLESAHA